MGCVELLYYEGTTYVTTAYILLCCVAFVCEESFVWSHFYEIYEENTHGEEFVSKK